MHNQKKRVSVLILICLLVTSLTFAQYNTYSPYTRFGLGNMALDGFGQNNAMGGTGIAIRDDDKLNYLNPAAYAARDSMSVLLDFGMNVTNNQYQTSNLSKNWWNGNFHHIAFSFPVTKYFGVGTGVVPYSSVGYNIKQEFDDLGTGDAIDYYYKGSGGIFKYFAGISGILFDRVSIGLNMNYLLGDINRERIMDFPKNRGFAETKATEEIQISNIYFNFGFLYKEVISDKFYFSVGASYDMEAGLNSAFSSYITNTFPGSSGLTEDSVLISPSFDITSDETIEPITIPSKIGLGFAVGIPSKLTFTGDYYRQDWAAVNNSSLAADGFDLATAQSLRAGIEYIPDYNAFRGYYNLMSYRIGGYINDSYVKVGDYQLKDYGITFGVGLPMGKTKSSMNIAATFGTRGTTDNNLVKENYGIITFSVTLHDLWFYKRKYD